MQLAFIDHEKVNGNHQAKRRNAEQEIENLTAEAGKASSALYEEYKSHV